MICPSPWESLGLSGTLEPERVRDWLILGELSLDGQVRPIRGALSVALHASRKKTSVNFCFRLTTPEKRPSSVELTCTRPLLFLR